MTTVPPSLPAHHPIWRKSTQSLPGDDCVEIAPLPGSTIGIRDSKNPTGPVLAIPATHWQIVRDHIKEGRHDLR